MTYTASIHNATSDLLNTVVQYHAAKLHSNTTVRYSTVDLC